MIHVQGLPFFVPINRPGAQLDVYGPPQDGVTIAEAFDAFMCPPYFPVGIADLPVELRQSATVSTPGAPVQSPVGQPRSMADIERQAILETLERLDGHRGKAAEALDIGLRTLQRKLKEYKDAGYYLEEEA